MVSQSHTRLARLTDPAETKAFSSPKQTETSPRHWLWGFFCFFPLQCGEVGMPLGRFCQRQSVFVGKWTVCSGASRWGVMIIRLETVGWRRLMDSLSYLPSVVLAPDWGEFRSARVQKQETLHLCSSGGNVANRRLSVFYVTTEKQLQSFTAALHTWLLSCSAEPNQPRSVHLETSCVSILQPSWCRLFPPFISPSLRFSLSFIPLLCNQGGF